MRFVLTLFVFALTGLSVLAAPQVNDGTITDVIVYRGQALVTRTIELKNGSGDVELLVENLPEQIIPESLYALSNDGIQVLSVRYRVKETEQDMRAEVKAIQEQIEAVETEIYQCTRDLQLCVAQSNRFQNMWDLSLEGANVSLDRGAFSSESMKDFTGYLEEKNQKWHEEAVVLELQKADLEKRLG